MNKKQPGDKGSIYSSLFDDHYFAQEDGLAESRYIFLEHNHLHTKGLKNRRQSLQVAELGFGTGLNFLLFWQEVAELYPNLPMTFSSVEKYPLLPEVIAEALSPWPVLQSKWLVFSNFYAYALNNYYREQTPGYLYRQQFANLQLNLFLGDVQDFFYHLPPQLDAWFLDGFAPAKNPAMWSASILNNVGQWTKAGGRFATFTAAGVVRRRLQSAGFVVEKGKGFGRKREMLFGYKPFLMQAL
jgi:tRNA 5-methylaminomethyl-2-thiouridine biosynthesis bifunctional protein